MLTAEWRNAQGDEVQAHGWRVTPVSRALLVRWRLGPGVAGALVWNRPRWLLVSDGERARRLSAPDATRGLQCLALAAGLALAWLLTRPFRGGKSR
jgi:hypothetical protein